jgi:hypothetical protein
VDLTVVVLGMYVLLGHLMSRCLAVLAVLVVLVVLVVLGIMALLPPCQRLTVVPRTSSSVTNGAYVWSPVAWSPRACKRSTRCPWRRKRRQR